jgi:D-alanyl-lipoteichoic acid acyltransferase DltB (MBOAT superfamily)
MIFNSFEFLIFLPVIFSLYWFVFNKSLQIQNILLLISSFFFYGWYDYRFLALIFLNIIIDYFFGLVIHKSVENKRRLFLIFGIVNNLVVLGVFKYFNFFSKEFCELLGLYGLNVKPYYLSVIMPIGISFYTFHGMSYIIDIYKKRISPTKNLVDYSLFVSFFPLLVAGPIERAQHLLPQIQNRRFFNYNTAVNGCRLILWGFFKKIVIADYLGTLVDPIFDNYESYSYNTLIWAAILFSFQIYGDFSGYSDIALGTSKLFGFELLSNFKFPYFSRDIAEFWRRWHISLSTWFKDYLYIPLGGSKVSKIKVIRNTFIIFLVSGFWHGASWNFIIWGGIHALAFLPLLLFNRNRINSIEIIAENRTLPSFKELVNVISTFLIVTFAWIFFRSKTLVSSINFIKIIILGIINDPSVLLTKPVGISGVLLSIPLIFFDWCFRRNERFLDFDFFKIYRYLIYLVISISIVCFFLNNTNSKFIYFQF